MGRASRDGIGIPSQRYLHVPLNGPMGEYAQDLCCCLFNKKTCAMLLSFLWAQQNLNVKARVTIHMCKSFSAKSGELMKQLMKYVHS